MSRRLTVLAYAAVALLFAGAAAMPLLLSNRPGGVAQETLTEPTRGGPRQIPVEGMPGHVLVLHDDGSSELIGPDGQSTVLTRPAAATTTTGREKGQEAPSLRKGEGRLVVCDRGVVEVPKGAVITLVAEDKVVTHDPTNGTSVTYHTDGRVVVRGPRASQ
jgi:hypothetical protein